MLRFPQALFLAGGVEVIEGRNFTTRLVVDEDELEQALAAGWHETAGAAADAADEAAKAAHGSGTDQKLKDGKSDGAPVPTRAELEAEATALGVEFSKKLGDAKLAERIAAAKAAQGA